MRDLTSVSDRASEYLHRGYPATAIRWFQEAVRLAQSTDQEATLCGILGDMAVAFHRVGDEKEAIRTYEAAIQLSNKHADWVNLSRWSQNLGLLLAESNPDRAALHFKEARKAAARSGVPRQISTAAGNHAVLLVQQQRYSEALEAVDAAINAADASLLRTWQAQRFVVLLRWGGQLRDEGQVELALDVWQKATAAAGMDDPQEMESLAFVWTSVAALHERRGRADLAGAALVQAAAVHRTLGQIDRADELENVSRMFSLGPDTIANRKSDLNIEALERQIEDAVARGDAQTEATLRVNLVTALLSDGDERTEAEFERVLTLVRRIQDRRRELILCINFAPYFLERAAADRAMALADRSVQLSETGNPGYAVYALANRARIWIDGKNSPGQAIADYLRCSELLQAYIEQNPEEQDVVANLAQTLARGAQLAMEHGTMEQALAIGAAIDPNLAALRTKSSSEPAKPAIDLDTEALAALSEPELDLALDLWNADGPERAGAGDKVANAYRNLVATLRWQWAAGRFSREPAADNRKTGHPGAAGLLCLAEMVQDRKIPLEVAVSFGRQLAVPDEDLCCIALFGLQDKRRASTGITFRAWELLAALGSAGPAARCYGLLGMFTAANDPATALAYYQSGARVLDGTDLVGERARLLMEAGALLAGPLRRFADALACSKQALLLAEWSGDRETVANAMGNAGLALLNLEQSGEAIDYFERLARLQIEANDQRGLEQTKFNLQLAHRRAGKLDRLQLDAGNEDCDVVFARAADLGLAGEYPEAISEFERGLALVDKDGKSDKPYAHHGQVLMNFARTLYSAGATARSIDVMKQAVLHLQSAHQLQDRHSALGWLAAVHVEDEVVGLGYAQEALAYSRQLGSAEELAIDLAQLAQNRVLAKKPGEAIAALEEAMALSPGNRPIRSTLALALAGMGRTAEARAIYEGMLAGAHDANERVTLLVGLSETLSGAGDLDGALLHLTEARDLTAGSVSREAAYVANHLGQALHRRGRLEEAAAVLERGIDGARELGLERLMLSLLNNFGQLLKDLGETDAAEAALLQAQTGFREAGMRASEAMTLAGLGNVSMSRNDPEQALVRFQEAVGLAQGVDATTEAACVDSLGSIYSQLGKPARSVEYHRRSAELHEELRRWDSLLVDLVNLGQVYLVLGELEAATSSLAKARHLADAHGLRDWNVPLLAGRIAAHENRWLDARKSFREAIEAVERVRGSLAGPEAQRQWAASKALVYRLAVEAAMEAADGEAAVEFIECSRARYLKAILDRRAKRPAGLDATTWLRYEQVADRLARARSYRRSQIASGEAADDQALHEVEREFRMARAAVDAAAGPPVADAAFEFPLFADLVAKLPTGCAAVWVGTYGRHLGLVLAGRSAAGDVWSAAELKQDSLAEGFLRLLLGERAAIDAARHDVTPLDELPTSALGLQLAGYFYGQHEASLEVARRIYGLDVRDPHALFARSLAHTCQWLGANFWPLVESHLPEGTSDVVLLPSAALNLLPLHAALTSTGRVDERYGIRYLPSLAMATHEQQGVQRQAQLGQVVNPSEDTTLPFSAFEAEAVGRAFGGAKVSKLVGREATAERVTDLLRESDVFHFAGHAFYNIADPLRSGLECAGADGKEDVVALATVLQRMQAIPGRLVVLSACDTGQIEPDDVQDDFLGLPGAFLVAGAGSVIASLWRVGDLATCLLVEKFFQIWGEGRIDAARALAAAQKWLRSEVEVAYVAKKLQLWKERAGDDEVLMEWMWDWFAREDQNSLAFPDEPAWAAFCATGLPARQPSQEIP